MTSFGRWMAEAHNEVSNHINSGLGKPARTMIRLSLTSFISAGTHLRRLAQVEPSDTPGRFTVDLQDDLLTTLRDSYETARKMFMFALINAKSGLSDAAAVIETEDGLLSKKEMKRLEAARSKPREKFEDYSSRPVTMDDLAMLLKGRGTGSSPRDLPRVICFKCQKPGHYATNCRSDDDKKKPRYKRARRLDSSDDEYFFFF